MSETAKLECQCGFCFFLAMEGSKYCVAHRASMEAYDRKRADIHKRCVPGICCCGSSDGCREDCCGMKPAEATRCAVCGWPLKATREEGCVTGDCSQRPLPATLYDRARVIRDKYLAESDVNDLYPVPGAAMEPTPPIHPFEVRINISGEDWDYVVRALDRAAQHLPEHGPDCNMMSGGAGGSFSVSIAKRDVTKEQFRAELEAWRLALPVRSTNGR